MNAVSQYAVNELYPCLQGEGASIGVPSILVRFQVCNLRCTWCDTPYTHTMRSDSVQRFSASELAAKIRATGPQRHLILTGGEPTLHNVLPLLDALGPGYSAEVETNGTRVPHLDLRQFSEADYSRLQWNVSPKGRNAGCEIVPTALEHWASLANDHPQVWFKFVIRRDALQASADLDELDALIARFQLPRERIFLMPEGTSPESQLGRTDLHDACIARGVRYTPRLHVLLFGAERGK